MSVRADVERLQEQAQFLVESQKSAQAECLKEFDDFKKLIKARLSSATIDERESLNEIHRLIDEHEKMFSSEIEEDVTFLNEQIKALKVLHSEKNEAKLKDQLDLLMEGEPVQEMAAFKKEVTEELRQTKQEFIAVLDDLKAALKEGEIEDLLVYLRELAATDTESGDEDEEGEIGFEFDPSFGMEEKDKHEDEDEEDECCAPKPEKKDSCCSSKKVEKKECCGGAKKCGDKCVCNKNCKCNRC
jgi:hypothetical protein